MRSRVRRVGVAAGLLATTLAIPVVISSPAHAADQPGGRIQLMSPQRLIDTRDSLGMQTNLQLPANGVLRITVLESNVAGQASLHPCGGPVDATSPLFSFRSGEIQTATLTTGSAPTCLASPTPVHVLVDRIGSASDAPTPSGLQVAGVNGLPADATAVTMNVTVTEPDGPGFVTVYPCDEARPEASNLNFVAGSTVPNIVTVKLSAAGTVCL